MRKTILIWFFIGIAFADMFASGRWFPHSRRRESDAPPRIIRKCCSFGTDVRMAGIPWVRYSELTSIEKLGPHRFLGSREENNGIIYTLKGGFIDMGHVRDQADWVNYLYTKILEAREEGDTEIHLGKEAGEKSLDLCLSPELDSVSCLALAQRIAYDLSVWHEIATWYGASLVPLLPERYSSFSMEDNYSNLLGVLIAGKVLRQEGDYETNMTREIMHTLFGLEPVGSEDDTRLAMESVLDIWWTNKKPLPSGKILLKRHLGAYPEVSPWLIPAQRELFDLSTDSMVVLKVPDMDSQGLPLSNYYQLNFRVNQRIPDEYPGQRKNGVISQLDFPEVLKKIGQEVEDYSASKVGFSHFR